MAATPESFPSRERSDYADAVGFIRVKEKRDLLSHGRLQEYLALSPEGIVERLRLPGDDEESDVDTLIGRLLAAEYAAVERFDHEGLVVPLLRSRFDLHNLKALLARRMRNDAPLAAPVPGNLSFAAIEQSLAGGGTGIAWPEPVALALRNILAAETFPATADILLDLAWIEHALDTARMNALSLVAHFCRCLGDLLAVRLVWRKISLQSLGLEIPAVTPPLHRLSAEILSARDPERLAEALLRSPYGAALRAGLGEWRAGAPWMAVERDMDNLLVEELAASRYVSLGPEPLFSFLVLREHDLNNLRFLHVARRAGWNDETTRRFLRRVHG